MSVIARVDEVFQGSVRPLPPEGQLTGMFKEPVAGPVRVEAEGLVGDEQADRRVHGGPEKAVHLFPADHYATLAAARPEVADRVRPGILGENLSTRGLTEADVCIGDVVRVGSVTLQVSQPRRPCWKIDHRLDAPGLNRVIVELGCPGWYYRVLEPGELAAGDDIELVERPAEGMTLAHLLAVDAAHRPDVEQVRLLAAAPGLEQHWVERLLRRAEWLENHRETNRETNRANDREKD